MILSKKFRPDILTPGSFLSKSSNIKESVDKINSLLENS